MPSSSFTFDATIANRRFTADAWILGTRLLHDRTLDHTGTEGADVVVLSATIGPYPQGTTVQAVLSDFAVRLTALEVANRVFAYFRVDAFIQPRFTANAIIKKNKTGSFTLDAVKAIAHSFTVNAVIKHPGTTSPTTFTIDAFLV